MYLSLLNIAIQQTLWQHWVLWILISLYFGVIMATIAVIILENRQPIKTIAWILVLTSIPVFGLLLFYFFGQNIRKERSIGKRTQQLFNQNESLKALIATPTLSSQNNHLAQLLENIGGLPIQTNNQLHIFTQGKAYFTHLLKDIEEAKEHIHLLFYIIEDDDIVKKLTEKLIKKAKEGVEVRLLYDDVGCWHTSKKFFKNLQKKGIETCPFLPVKFQRLTNRINYRNHRKIIVIDGKIGYIGGMNMARRYVGTEKAWRDTQLRIVGETVHSLQYTFLSDWYFAKEELLKEETYYYPPIKANMGKVAIQICNFDPVSKWQSIFTGLITMIYQAKQTIYIQTPYFMPSEPFIQALQSASLSGVKVKLMLPRKPDSWLLRFANEAYFADVLQAGVEIFIYQPSFLHSKMVVVDQEVATVGSSNIDFRSFENNFESNAFIYHKESVVQLSKAFEEDLKQATPITYSQWKQRKKRHKILQSLTRIFSPLF